jgi:hypothetical protein
MRKYVKHLANFLGATKELTSDIVELAEITEDELDQMRLGLLSRERRKPTVKLLSDGAVVASDRHHNRMVAVCDST